MPTARQLLYTGKHSCCEKLSVLKIKEKCFSLTASISAAVLKNCPSTVSEPGYFNTW